MEVVVTHEVNHELVIEVGRERHRIAAVRVADDGKFVLLAYRDIRGEWRFQRADSGGSDRIELRGSSMSLGQLPEKWLQQISRERLPVGCPTPPLSIGQVQLDLFDDLPRAPIVLAAA